MKTLSKPSSDGLKAERALKNAVARMADENRRLGHPVAVMLHDKAVLISTDAAMKVVHERPSEYTTRLKRKIP
ncbi:MAG: hypothetical protein WCI95_09395 [bacterium]